ncbi:hypothetical protein HCC61_12705 [Streptomyces sp. HNM0575]|uniref:hypothetical protein n=1 Tax=Streptomyces sp. HNM0575 TaxID=2716338 RepID=UPI00145CE00F|nr:hypothetical protein [Streptomyces sp. HNM0575]NLU73528.1 hypothetical protein [Streptomyces sp. HNM0575]
MAHSRSRKRSRRRTLRREAPSIVPVVADEAHFARMRGYGSFAFDDHRSYLRRLEGLLRELRAGEVHARVALFDPVDYELYCQEQRLDPDTAANRGRYVAEVAAAGATVAYAGQTLGRLLPQLRDAHACRVTWQAGAEILAKAGSCARCGRDIGKAAFERAARALSTLLDAAGPGAHHLVVSVAVPGSPLVTALDVRRTPAGDVQAHEAAALALTTAVAAGFATVSHGGLVFRTEAGGAGGGSAGGGGADRGGEGDGVGVGGEEAPRDVDVVRGWRLDPVRSWLTPLSAAEVFAAYCTDPATREPVAPEPGVEHAPGFELPHPGGELHC